MLETTSLPFIGLLCDLVRTQRKLAHYCTVVENTFIDVIMNPPYLCMMIVSYRSRSYVICCELSNCLGRRQHAKTHDNRRQCISQLYAIVRVSCKISTIIALPRTGEIFKLFKNLVGTPRQYTRYSDSVR